MLPTLAYSRWRLLCREWQLAGAWLDQEKPGEWQAVANGPGGSSEVEVGHGGDPSQALRGLAEALQKRRGLASG